MFEKLDAAATKTNSFVCVGLDPSIERAPINDIGAFNRAIIDATKDVVCAFKPQFAYYEAMGIPGLKILDNTWTNKNLKDYVFLVLPEFFISLVSIISQLRDPSCLYFQKMGN